MGFPTEAFHHLQKWQFDHPSHWLYVEAKQATLSSSLSWLTVMHSALFCVVFPRERGMKISERVLAEAEGRVAVIGLTRGTRWGNMALTELLPASILGCAALRCAAYLG